jgi:hypothetical protein
MMELSKEQEAIMRQQEFPQMLRDIVDTGAEEIEITIDAKTALILASALELFNTITGVDEL